MFQNAHAFDLKALTDKIKKIKGEYLIENNKFYLDKIVINNKPVSNRILLSQFNKRCYNLV